MTLPTRSRRYPEVFQRFDLTPPSGVLFFGPPGTRGWCHRSASWWLALLTRASLPMVHTGCGKTLVARALANSCTIGGKRVSFFMRKVRGLPRQHCVSVPE